MRRIFRQFGLAAAVTGMFTVAACSGPKATDSELEQDLKQASSTSLQLAPQGAGTSVISAIEQTPTARPAAAPQRARSPQQAPRRGAPAPRPATRVAARPVERPTPSPAEAAPAPQSVTVPTARPTAPQQRPIGEKPGVYKSEGEVLRNLPVPVNP